MDPQLNESFNKIKNILYKKDAFEKRYSFEELAELIAKPLKSEEEEKTLKSIAMFIKAMNESIQDLGTQIMRIKDINFDDRQEIENAAKEIILIIDEFIDSLIALSRTFDFKENRANLKISEVKLKKLRNAIIHSLNEMRFKINTTDTDKEQVKTLINDIIDNIIDQSVILRIEKLYKVFEVKKYI